MAPVDHTIDSDLATIVINNPPQNRIGVEFCDGLEEAIYAIGASQARAVLLRAEGANFSLGGDIEPWPDWDQRQRRSAFERFMAVFNRFERLPIPTVAAVQGLCLGGGLELAVRADLIIAGHTAHFGHPEQSIGIVTILGGVYRIAERVGRAKAMEWALTAERVPAQEMARLGVVNRVVADEDLQAEAVAFARALAQGPTKAHAAHKALLRIWATGGITAADEAMFDLALPLWDTDDTRMAIPTAVEALREGRPRPALPFTGH
jgi:enoyl-CoA hydratase/carnithine racemase